MFLVAVQMAKAGPWPREPGQGFTSVTGTYRYVPDLGSTDTEGSFYLEYGLSPEVTLGFDAHDSSGGYSHAFGFLRWPVLDRDKPLKLAVTIGAGASRQQDRWRPMLALGFSVGRGINLGRPGWWSVTTQIQHHKVLPDPVFKLDTTVGLQLAPKWKTFADLETSYRRGTSTGIGFRISLAREVSPGHHLHIGLEGKKSGTKSYGLRVGIWRKF